MLCFVHNANSDTIKNKRVGQQLETVLTLDVLADVCWQCWQLTVLTCVDNADSVDSAGS